MIKFYGTLIDNYSHHNFKMQLYIKNDTHQIDENIGAIIEIKFSDVIVDALFINNTLMIDGITYKYFIKRQNDELIFAAKEIRYFYQWLFSCFTSRKIIIASNKKI